MGTAANNCVKAAPKASANFLHLCLGDKVSPSGEKLTLKGSKFSKVFKNFMVQAGPPTNCSIYCSESNPTGQFEDESMGDFDTVFRLAMANTGPNTNTSQFFINTYPSPHLNGKHTIFGSVLFGKSTVRTIERENVDANGSPLKEIIIEDCGEWVESMGVPVYNTSYSQLGGDIYEEYPDDDTHFDKDKTSEAYNAANVIKESGSLLFKQKSYKEAFFKYHKSLRYVMEFITDKDQDPEFSAKFQDLKKKLYLNLSLTCINIKDFTSAVKYSTFLLESDDLLPSEAAKGHYRRGVSLLELKKFQDSLKDLQKCKELNPNDKIVDSKIELAEQAIQNIKLKEKQKYAKFFG